MCPPHIADIAPASCTPGCALWPRQSVDVCQSSGHLSCLLAPFVCQSLHMLQCRCCLLTLRCAPRFALLDPVRAAFQSPHGAFCLVLFGFVFLLHIAMDTEFHSPTANMQQHCNMCNTERLSTASGRREEQMSGSITGLGSS